jgi:hypothetical protein
MLPAVKLRSFTAGSTLEQTEGTGSAEDDVQAELLLYLVKALEEQTMRVDDTLGRELDRIADALELQNQLLAQIAGRL